MFVGQGRPSCGSEVTLTKKNLSAPVQEEEPVLLLDDGQLNATRKVCVTRNKFMSEADRCQR